VDHAPHSHRRITHSHLNDPPKHEHYGRTQYWVPEYVAASGRRDEGEYHFVPGEILIDDDNAKDPQVRNVLKDYSLTPYPPTGPATEGGPAVPPEETRPLPPVSKMRMLTMPADADQRIVVPEIVDRVRRLDPRARWPQVAPNHVLFGATHKMFGPTEPPKPRKPAFDRLPDVLVGEGVTVAVLDTGIVEHPVLPDFDPNEFDEPDEDDDDELDWEAGHGTFIEGVIRRYAPRVRVVQKRVLTSNGRVSDTSLAERLFECRDADIINLSLGGYTHDNRGTYALPRLFAWLRRRNPHQVIVAAAGNDHTDRPVFPAAMKGVIAVAGCDDNGDWADYSNFGWWVDARARGRHVSTFYTLPSEVAPKPLTLRFSTRTAEFSGWAQWEGTSFAAPVVAAAIAAKMTELSTGSARTAARALLDAAAGTYESGIGVLIDPVDYTT
jgi:hypothetical protein